MKKQLFFVVMALCFAVLLGMKNAGAQYYGNHPVPPMVMCNGGWIPQGTPCGGYGGHQQPVMVAVQGQQNVYRYGGNQYYCSPLASWGGAIAGAVVGGLVGQRIQLNNHRLAAGGAIIGAFAGKEISCQLFGGTVQQQGQVVQNVPMQVGMNQQYGQQGGQRVNVPSVCRFADGKVLAGAECDAYHAKRQAELAHSTQTPTAQSQQIAQVTQPQTPVCKAGSSWKRLNWKGENGAPDHPQHGKHVCLPDGDSHRFEGE